jgi:2-C-methyl-D-erythritol 4-phosphate cytidylyltransferase
LVSTFRFCLFSSFANLYLYHLEKIAIIVAAGKGVRLGEPLPKQFLILAGKPVLYWSILKFHSAGARVVVVLHPSMLQQWEHWIIEFSIPEHELVMGGAERFHSVKNALDSLIEEDALVAIHDAARPNISVELIHLLFQECAEKGSAVPYTRPADSVRFSGELGPEVIDRDRVLLIQTPQCFTLRHLRNAYQVEYQMTFTDDASVMEHHVPGTLHFLEGQKQNFKITHPSDWELMQLIFKS